MSGIAGFMGTDRKNELAKQANLVQLHRGRDKQSLWHDELFSFAHQYFSVESKAVLSTYAIEYKEHLLLFAGELYNTEELIRLSGKTYHSDTFDYPAELLIDLYLEYDTESFSKLRGMFAFAIYNCKNQELILVRDQFGIKPLFYYQQNEVFAFSSELKTLLYVPGFSKKLNSKALVSSLNYVWVSGNESMFESVRKLPPSHYLLKKPGMAPVISRYWDYSGYNEELNRRAVPELAEKIGNLFESSVIRQLPKTGKVGAFLSGGLDSSLISVITNKYKSEFSTFTIATTMDDKKGGANG